jgi:o-succinylbenzoate synthase
VSVTAAAWLPYRLALRRPWQTARGLLHERTGTLLRLTTADGLTGWGDAAPLPEFGISEAAALAFAEECAQLDLAAQRAGLSLAAWLSGAAPVESVAVNAVAGALFSLSGEQIAESVGAGFSVIKVKVGIDPVVDELRQLKHLSSTLPAGILWRLDANGAWSLADAVTFIAGCRDLPVEGLEEPLRDPELATLRELQANAAFPLAIDESTQLINEDFWTSPPVRRLIIKPARNGGLLASVALALRAQMLGVECVLTSSLESACGLIACAQLAAVIAPQATHGLATAEWLVNDTGRTPRLAGGRLYLPAQTGLGFIPDFPGRHSVGLDYTK